MAVQAEATDPVNLAERCVDELLRSSSVSESKGLLLFRMIRLSGETTLVLRLII